MTKNHNTMRSQIRNALEPIRPDTDARERMYHAILKSSAQQVKPKKPWYLRWQVSVGIGAAAMACVMMVIFSAHTRLPQDSTQQLEVLPPTVTEQQPDIPGTEVTRHTQTQTIAMTTDTAQCESTVQADASVPPSMETTQADRDAQPITDTMAHMQNNTEPAGMTTKSSPTQTTNAATQTEPHHAQHPETSPPGTTMASATGATDTTVAVTETAPVTQPTSAQTEPVNDAPPIRQNIYLYNMLTWDKARYQTNYETVDSSTLTYLGAGITDGKDVSDTYTVLVYEIEGVDPSKALAVQYAGENCYYRFTLV